MYRARKNYIVKELGKGINVVNFRMLHRWYSTLTEWDESSGIQVLLWNGGRTASGQMLNIITIDAIGTI